jgi:MFS transporter, DHA1 family, inner membrane transport protein
MKAGTGFPGRAASHRSEDGGSRWSTVVLVVGAGVVSAFQVGKAPTALLAVQADLSLDLSTASWLLSAFAIVGAFTGAAVGIAVDHLGARRMVLGGLLLQAACSALGAMAEGAPLLLAARVIEGLGFLTVTVAAPTLVVGVVAPQGRGRAMAVWGTFMPVGIALVMLAAPLLTAIGWRGFWLVNAAVLLVYAVLLAGGTRRMSPDVASGRSIAGDVWQAASAGGPWLLGGLMAAFAAAFFAVFGFLPAILSDRLGVTPETGSLLTAAAVAANVVGNLACGPLLDRGIRRAPILIAAFAGMALCGFGILGGGVSGPLAYAACIAFSAVGGLIPVALLDGASRHAPRPELVGATVGVVMQGNNIGLVVGPAAAGAVAAVRGWAAVPLLIAALAVTAGLLAYLLSARPAEAAPCK